MASKDLHNNLKFVPAIAPVVVADNTASVSAIIDTQGYEGVEFVIQTGTLADVDATFAVTLEHGNVSNLSDTAVPATSDLIGTVAGASFTFADDGVTKKIGYVGSKRYVRLTITPTGNSGNAPISAMAVLGAPRHGPVT